MLGFAAIGRFALGQHRTSRAYSAVADAGGYTITGISAGMTLVRVGALGAGAFTWTGLATGLGAGTVASVGQYQITGPALALAATRFVTASAGAFSLTGNPALLTGSVSAAPAAFVIAGQQINIFRGNILECFPYVSVGRRFFGVAALGEVGLGQLKGQSTNTYSISAQSLVFGLSLTANAGAYAIAPVDVGFARNTAKIRAFLRVGANTISARPIGREMRARAYGG